MIYDSSKQTLERPVSLLKIWLQVLRFMDGAYFVWRGIHKWLTSPKIWLVPRVTKALPTTPLAPFIRAWIFPHLMAFGLTLGTIEVVFGLALLTPRFRAVGASVLLLLNTLFFFTLGFAEPHDLALNLIMGTLNLMFILVNPRFVYYTSKRNQ